MSNLCLKVLVLLAITKDLIRSLAITIQFGKLFQASATLYSISKIKLTQVIFETSFENSQIITPGCLDASCFQMWYHICIVFPRKYLRSVYHISSYPPIVQG